MPDFESTKTELKNYRNFKTDISALNQIIMRITQLNNDCISKALQAREGQIDAVKDKNRRITKNSDPHLKNLVDNIDNDKVKDIFNFPEKYLAAAIEADNEAEDHNFYATVAIEDALRRLYCIVDFLEQNEHAKFHSFWVTPESQKRHASNIKKLQNYKEQLRNNDSVYKLLYPQTTSPDYFTIDHQVNHRITTLPGSLSYEFGQDSIVMQQLKTLLSVDKDKDDIDFACDLAEKNRDDEAMSQRLLGAVFSNLDQHLTVEQGYRVYRLFHSKLDQDKKDSIKYKIKQFCQKDLDRAYQVHQQAKEDDGHKEYANWINEHIHNLSSSQLSRAIQSLGNSEDDEQKNLFKIRMLEQVPDNTLRYLTKEQAIQCVTIASKKPQANDLTRRLLKAFNSPDNQINSKDINDAMLNIANNIFQKAQDRIDPTSEKIRSAFLDCFNWGKIEPIQKFDIIKQALNCDDLTDANTIVFEIKDKTICADDQSSLTPQSEVVAYLQTMLAEKDMTRNQQLSMDNSTIFLNLLQKINLNEDSQVALIQQAVDYNQLKMASDIIRMEMNDNVAYDKSSSLLKQLARNGHSRLLERMLDKTTLDDNNKLDLVKAAVDGEQISIAEKLCQQISDQSVNYNNKTNWNLVQNLTRNAHVQLASQILDKLHPETMQNSIRKDSVLSVTENIISQPDNKNKQSRQQLAQKLIDHWYTQASEDEKKEKGSFKNAITHFDQQAFSNHKNRILKNSSPTSDSSSDNDEKSTLAAATSNGNVRPSQVGGTFIREMGESNELTIAEKLQKAREAAVGKK